MVPELKVAATMTVKDQDGNGHFSKSLTGSHGDSLADTLQLKEQFSCTTDYSPKARKPYTITKQRERWSEEEHQKFLEALKLHGRAWRKIEEHVGTKTAVQIRSHAQKFFSKVVRESNDSNINSIEPIEIPPPRPKRKPMHPYPRKLAHQAIKENLVLEQPRRSVSPNLSLSEVENQSPKSVLSAFASDALGSTGSSTPSPDCTLSPTSSADGNSLLQLFLASDLSAEKNPEKSSRVGEELKRGTLKLFGTTLVIPNSPAQDSPFIASSRCEPNNFELQLFFLPDSVCHQTHTTETANECIVDEVSFIGRSLNSEKVVSVVGASKRTRGFMPYKRCVAQDRESQRVRLSL